MTHNLSQKNFLTEIQLNNYLPEVDFYYIKAPINGVNLAQRYHEYQKININSRIESERKG